MQWEGGGGGAGRWWARGKLHTPKYLVPILGGWGRGRSVLDSTGMVKSFVSSRCERKPLSKLRKSSTPQGCARFPEF